MVLNWTIIGLSSYKVWFCKLETCSGWKHFYKLLVFSQVLIVIRKKYLPFSCYRGNQTKYLANFKFSVIFEGSAIYHPNSLVLMLRYCANLKAIRYESTSLNRIVADKSHHVIVALNTLHSFMILE